MYRLFVPAQAVGANLVYFDLFNSTQGVDLDVLSVIPIVSGATAVVGTLAVDLFLTRTTSIGTGGTAATLEGSSLTAPTFTHMIGSASLPSQVSARLTPTGGATAGAVLCSRSVYTEETNSAAYTPQFGMARAGVDSGYGTGLWVRPGTGIRVVQGSVASVGNIGFDILFIAKVK